MTQPAADAKTNIASATSSGAAEGDLSGEGNGSAPPDGQKDDDKDDPELSEDETAFWMIVD